MNGSIDYAFLHGGGQGSWVWADTIAALRVQAQEEIGKVLALDIPGCGVKRGQATDRLTPHDVALQLIDDLERAQLRNIVLTGHSLAGNVLPALAEIRPELFRRLVYVSCSIPLEGQTVLQMMGGGLRGSNANEVGWPDAARAAKIQDRYETLFCTDMAGEQKRTFLSRLDRDDWPRQFFTNTKFTFSDRVPATYVLCLQDNVLPVEWQEKFARRFYATRVVRIDAGHQVMITRPHALAEVLRHEASSAISPG